MQPKTIVAIPCFRTADHIGDIVTRAKRYVAQVIVIDDGSGDDTAEVAELAGALVIQHDTNKGYGEAIKSCLREARTAGADILVTLDGDGQHNPDEIPRLLSPMLLREADIVVGSRFLGDTHSVPRYRKFGISVITFLWNFGSKVKVSDTQSGFRAYSKRVLEMLHLSEVDMNISIEILEQARQKGTPIKEVPMSCRYASSTFGTRAVKHGLSVALFVIKIRLRNLLCSRNKGVA